MSLADAADRALVRRFNFLGFPGEKHSGALSYAGLRSELGDENANALVVQVGVLAKVHHLDQFGIGIDNAVARIIQSLTPDERRLMAQGGSVPPRVEGMITAEVEAAKLQQKQIGAGPQNGKSDPSLAQPLSGFGTAAFAAWRGSSGQGDSGGGSASAASTSAGGGVSPATIARYARDYAGMGFDAGTIGTFAKVGLAANDFRELNKRWERQDVVKGAETANELGMHGKRDVKAVTGMSEEEHRKWQEFRGEHDKTKRDEIWHGIQQLPTHKNKSQPETSTDRNHTHEIQERWIRRYQSQYRHEGAASLATSLNREASPGQTPPAQKTQVASLDDRKRSQHKTRSVIQHSKDVATVAPDPKIKVAVEKDRGKADNETRSFLQRRRELAAAPAETPSNEQPRQVADVQAPAASEPKVAKVAGDPKPAGDKPAGLPSKEEEAARPVKAAAKQPQAPKLDA
jgi:hypothetical protein